ncbi:MAG: hypothetical protein ACK5ME_09285 [Parahaliea sp.]
MGSQARIIDREDGETGQITRITEHRHTTNDELRRIGSRQQAAGSRQQIQILSYDRLALGPAPLR